MTPTIGRIVHYVLSETDAAEINRRRTNGFEIKQRLDVDKWPAGAQAHIGNEAKAGTTVPLMITAVWSSECINGQAFLDGTDVIWKTSILKMDVNNREGRWNWPITN